MTEIELLKKLDESEQMGSVVIHADGCKVQLFIDDPDRIPLCSCEYCEGCTQIIPCARHTDRLIATKDLQVRKDAQIDTRVVHDPGCVLQALCEIGITCQCEQCMGCTQMIYCRTHKERVN